MYWSCKGMNSGIGSKAFKHKKIIFHDFCENLNFFLRQIDCRSFLKSIVRYSSQNIVKTGMGYKAELMVKVALIAHGL